MEFRDKIKSLRNKLGMTMDELSKKVGVSTPTIQRYESGEIKNVRRDKIQLLADALETTPSYLMDWTESDSDSVGIDRLYLSFAKQAQDDGILPEDITEAIALIKKFRNKE